MGQDETRQGFRLMLHRPAPMRDADQTVLHDAAHPSHVTLPVVPTG